MPINLNLPSGLKPQPAGQALPSTICHSVLSPRYSSLSFWPLTLRPEPDTFSQTPSL